MAETPRLTAKDLTQEELVELVDGLVERLWPRGDRGEEWTPDTIDGVAQDLQSYGLDPA